MSDTVQADVDVKNTTEIEYAVKNPRIEKFIESLENNSWGKAKELGKSLGGHRYNYVFNDYGLPNNEYQQEIFCRLYFRQLSVMRKSFLGDRTFDGYNYLDVFKSSRLKSEELWKQIVDDAESKGVHVTSNEYNLGVYFYLILYLRCIYELNKDKETFRDAQVLSILQGNKTDKFQFDTVEDMSRIVDSIRRDLESNRLSIEKASSLLESIDNTESIQAIIDRMNDGYLFEKCTEQTEENVGNIEENLGNVEEDVGNIEEDTLKNEEQSTENIEEPVESQETDQIEEQQEESLEDTDNVEEIDMSIQENEGNVVFSAFGINLGYNVPDFATVSKTQELVDKYLYENKYIPNSDKDVLRSVILRPDQKETNIVGMLNDGSTSEQVCWGTVQNLLICWMMKNNLYGLTSEQTEDDIIDKISDRNWIIKLKRENFGMSGDIFKVKLYKK